MTDFAPMQDAEYEKLLADLSRAAAAMDRVAFASLSKQLDVYMQSADNVMKMIDPPAQT